MTKSVHCYVYEKRKEFLEALNRTIIKTQNLDCYNNKESLASIHFTGSKQSFDIECGNLSSNNKLKEYGYFSILVILECLCDLFNELNLEDASTIIISHYGHILVKISNERNILYPCIVGLDIADLIDNLSSSISACTIDETIHHILDEEHKESDINETLVTSSSNTSITREGAKSEKSKELKKDAIISNIPSFSMFLEKFKENHNKLNHGLIAMVVIAFTIACTLWSKLGAQKAGN